MTTTGWILLSVSWGCIILLNAFCIARMIKMDRKKG